MLAFPFLLEGSRIPTSWSPHCVHRGPKDHINMGILQAMVSGILFAVGRSTRMAPYTVLEPEMSVYL